MKYQILKGRINGHHIGEVIEMDEKLANAYGNKYLKAIKEEKNKENNESKEQKNIQNKALTNDDTNTKGVEKNG